MPGARARLLAIVVGAALLRAWCFVGWGLGDDAYYAATAAFLGRGRFELGFGSNYRLGLHVPNALAFLLLGVSDFAFVLLPLSCSLATILVIARLGARLGGERAGLIAALLLACSPFDAVYSTSMTIDVVSSFLCAAAALLLLRGEQAPLGRARLEPLLAALLLFGAYLVKIPALLFCAALFAYAAPRRELWRMHASCYAALAGLLAAACLADLLASGDAFGYASGERRWAPRYMASLGLAWYLDFYPRTMFVAPGWGTRPFGFTCHSVALALGYAAARRLCGTRLPVTWLLGLFLLLEFLPHRVQLPYQPMPRYARYLDALIVPGLLLVALALDDLWSRRPRAGGIVLAALLALALPAAYRTAATHQDALHDLKLASRFLLEQPPADVFADSRFLDRLNFDDGYNARFGLRYMQEAIEKHPRLELLHALGPGYAVTGGSRGVDFGEGAILSLGRHPPPARWRLLYTHAGPPRPWRKEPLRVFAISPEG